MFVCPGDSSGVAMHILKQMIFGKRWERLAVIVAEQLVLQLDDLETCITRIAPANDDADATKPAGKPRTNAKRNIGGLPKHLPRSDQARAVCTRSARTSRSAGRDPGDLRVLRMIRPKYGCRGCTDGRGAAGRERHSLQDGGLRCRSLPGICR
jgi:transposase